MSWQDRWNEQDGRYVYRDHTVDITYTIDRQLFNSLDSLDDAEREEFLAFLMAQAAEAIGRNALRDIH